MDRGTGRRANGASRFQAMDVDETFVQLKERLQARTQANNIWCVSSSLINISFGCVGLYMYAHNHESCESPLSTLLLTLSIVFLLIGVLMGCACIHVRATFESFITSPTREALYSRLSASSHHARLLDQGDDDDDENDDINIEIKNHKNVTTHTHTKLFNRGPHASLSDHQNEADNDEEVYAVGGRLSSSQKEEVVVAATITDSILMACCSCSYVFCATLIMIACAITVLTYSFMSAGNCSTKAPNLLYTARIYGICCLCSVGIHVYWFIRGYTDALYLWDIHFVEQQMVKEEMLALEEEQELGI